MSCLLTYAGDPPLSVSLTHGPEWGYRSEVVPAIEWSQMSSGLWRHWDAGAERDIYLSTWTFRGTSVQISELSGMISSLRGKSISLSSTDGIWPFGPLVDCSSPVRVRIGPYSPSGVIIGADRWSLEIPIYLTQSQPRPDTQGSLATFLARAKFSPSLAPGWGVSLRDSLSAPVDAGVDSYQTVATALLSSTDIIPAVRQLLWLRGAPFSVPSAAVPFGPGVPLSNGAGAAYFCRAKAFSWSHETGNLWVLSATLVRDP